MIKYIFLGCSIAIAGSLLTTNINKESQMTKTSLTEEEIISSIFENIQGCSEISYCADGYTIDGFDRNGYPRGHIYPEKRISKREYLASHKSYNYNGYDQYGFDREGKNSDGIHFNTLKYIKY